MTIGGKNLQHLRSRIRLRFACAGSTNGVKLTALLTSWLLLLPVKAALESAAPYSSGRGCFRANSAATHTTHVGMLFVSELGITSNHKSLLDLGVVMC